MTERDRYETPSRRQKQQQTLEAGGKIEELFLSTLENIPPRLSKGLPTVSKTPTIPFLCLEPPGHFCVRG